MAEQAPKPDLLVYQLGTRGVNVAVSPLHAEPGELTKAQNASFFGDGARGGLSKRQGMRALNTTALAGEVLAMVNVTFADPAPPSFLTDDSSVTLTDDVFLPLTDA